MWKLGLRPGNSQKRNMEMGFSLQCDVLDSLVCQKVNNSIIDLTAPSACLKVWWHDTTLFVYFDIFYSTVHTFIPSHSYSTFIRRHMPRFLSISSSLVSSVGKTSLWLSSRESNWGKPTDYHRIYIEPSMSHVAPWKSYVASWLTYVAPCLQHIYNVNGKIG